MSQSITVKIIVNAPISKVWEYWTNPNHITQWAFASDDWEAPAAENDVRVDGRFKTTMAAKDKSASFDFTGTYTAVETNKFMEYNIDDGRQVKIEFAETPEGVVVTETFEMEGTHSEEQQRSGWQAILENFKKHVESNS